LINRLFHCIKFIVDLVIPKPEHTPTFFFQLVCPFFVGSGFSKVRFTIKLNCDLEFHARKVYYKSPNRMLPAKLESAQGAIAESAPQQSFSRYVLFAKCSCRLNFLGQFVPPLYDSTSRDKSV
jgi:hypothetical protein